MHEQQSFLEWSEEHNVLGIRKMKEFVIFWIMALGIIFLVIGVTGVFSSHTKNPTASVSEVERTDAHAHERRGENVSEEKAGLDQRPLQDEHAYYKFHVSCQVPGLSELYEQVFGLTPHGQFVEFGAFDGELYSNTSGLADIGWRGLYIEPNPEFAEKCAQRHAKNQVVVVPYAVGSDERTITLNLGGAYSTVSEETKKIYNNEKLFQVQVGEKTIQVQQRKLHDILLENHVQPGFEVMVVDIEGFEWEALRNFDISYWKPRVVIIEIEDQHEAFQTRNSAITEEEFQRVQQRFQNLRTYFKDAQYDILYQDYINTMYVLPK